MEKALNRCPQSVCLLLLNSTVLPGLVKNQLSLQKKRTLRPLKNVQKVLWWFQRFFAYHQTTERMFLLQVSSQLFLLYLNHGNLLEGIVVWFVKRGNRAYLKIHFFLLFSVSRFLKYKKWFKITVFVYKKIPYEQHYLLRLKRCQS